MKYFTATALLILIFLQIAKADHHNKVLYKDAVVPVLAAKCAGCHGDDKQKGKLRVDSIEAIMKGGSEGAAVVVGKPKESTLMQRIHLPLDDDEHMPPEDKDQLSKEEIAVLEFWIQSGAKADATIASLKAPPAISKSIVAVLSALPAPSKATAKKTGAPKELTESDKKLIADTMKKVNAGGGNLMPIAQDTPQLRFSALNVAKEFGDSQLAALNPVGKHILWLDVARSQVTDSGLANLKNMPNLTRLHLENTKITDAGLTHLAGLKKLEYLNLYGTPVSDAGIAKLSKLNTLQKLYLWQTKATDKGVALLSKSIPGIDINTGWKEPVKVAAVAAPAKPEAKKPAAPTTPAKKPATPAKKPATPAKKPATPAKKPATPAKNVTPATKKPTPKPAPAPKKPTPPPSKPAVKPAPAKPAPAAPKGTLEAALAELKAAAEKAKQETAAAKSAYQLAEKQAAEAAKAAEDMKAAMARAESIEKVTLSALQELNKAVEASKK